MKTSWKISKAQALLGTAAALLLIVALASHALAQQWIQLAPSGAPPPGRGSHSGVYDPTTNRMMVFGGTASVLVPADFANDTWILENANGLGGTPTWTQLFPTGGPPVKRAGHTAVYDVANNRMIVFGGCTAPCDLAQGPSQLNDVWVLSSANGLGGTPAWTQLFPAGTPSPRETASAVYDAATNRMTIFGGGVYGTSTNDVWVLSNANGLGGTPTWTQLFPIGAAPLSRDTHAAIYDQATNEMVVFGGRITFPISTDANDVWVLTNANGLGGTPTWVRLAPGGTPPAVRAQPKAVYDPVTNRMTMFGGNKSSPGSPPPPQHNDVWVLTNASGLGGAPTWVELSPAGTPPIPRSGATATLDVLNNRMTVFGGCCSAESPFLVNDTWVLTGANGIITITVAIDIKPGSDPNSINLSSAGVVPVAILSSPTFDATQVDPETVSLAGAGVKLIGKGSKYACSVEDANGDGLPDLVCHVETAQFILEPGDSVAVLEAETFGGEAIRGEDAVRIVSD